MLNGVALYNIKEGEEETRKEKEMFYTREARNSSNLLKGKA